MIDLRCFHTTLRTWNGVGGKPSDYLIGALPVSPAKSLHDQQGLASIDFCFVVLFSLLGEVERE